MSSRWMRLLMTEDGGGAGGAGGGEPAGGTGTGGTGGGGGGENQPELPKYFSQFSPEHRASQEYRDALGKFARLDDLADAYIESERHKGDYIRRLTKDSTDEEVKAWAKEMGIPETKDGYRFADDEGREDPVEKGTVAALKEIAWKYGMSSRQAEAAWAFVKGLGAVGAARQAKAADEARKSFDGKLAELYKSETASDKEAQDKAKAAAGLFAKFGTQTGIGKALVDSGLAYDPAFVKAVAAYVGSHDPQLSGGTTVGGGRQKGLGAFGNDYAPSSRRAMGI